MRTLMCGTKRPLVGRLSVPGDKSLSHRSVIIGAISEGITVVNHFLMSEDCLSTVAAFRDMGVEISKSGNTLVIHGRGISALSAPKHPLNMGNSGTTARLLIGLLSGRPFPTELIGDASLSRRPMRRIIDPLRPAGARVSATAEGTLPVRIHARTEPLKAIRSRMDVASAQVKSGLIFAALQAEGPSVIIEKQKTRDHTERMLRAFGARVQTNGLRITVEPGAPLSARPIDIPSDLSSAAFFIAAATLVPGSRLCLEHIGVNPTRTGFLRALERMGAPVTLCRLTDDLEPAADVYVQPSPLRAIDIGAADVPGLIDELPLLALLATQAAGMTVITGAGELRVKECDRIRAVTEELSKLGAAIEELPDGMRIIGGTPLCANHEVCLDAHGDHRIGMMLTIASLIAEGGEVAISGSENVNISYPTFFADLEQLLRA
ncbi:MAG: 3-phosphoshikimate 1-carboxyvinyltransferase [Sporolactobacillus sp.]